MNSIKSSNLTSKPLSTKVFALASGLLISVASLYSTAYADDTEVFFGQVDPNTNVHPNVLFVLDTSGSMNSGDGGYSGTRLERMKSALNTILDNSTNVNVGLMRMNGFYGGGSVLYPVTGIEEPICPNNDCGSVNLVSRIAQEDDDMEQYVNNGGMEQWGNHLSMGQSGNNPQLVGYRFQDIEIPSGATITSASIEFTSTANNSGDADLTIHGHDIDDAPVIATTNYYLRDSVKTSESVAWDPEAWTTGNIYQSPDLSAIVQEIADRPNWCGGNSLGFIVEGTGERRAYSYNNSPSRAALLRITYDSESIPANQGCVRKRALAQIDSSIDDAEQRLHNGKIRADRTQVRMPRRGNGSNSRVLNRLRFTNLAIPQGSIIENASIQFEVDDSRNDTLDLTFEIENTDSAPPLIIDNWWIANQATAAATVAWPITSSDIWAVNEKVSTPDLSTLVQTIVDRPGWLSNNDMAFRISEGSTGTGRRYFESYDGEQPAAAKLSVEYRTNIGSSGGGQIVYNTARDDMKKVVNELSATGGTPIVAAYYEAVQYMLGGPVDYGTERGYYRHRYHRVSHPDSYTGGSVSRPAGCSDANLEGSSCTHEEITGSATYKSPLADSCQTNHIVFLSDGVPTSNTAISKVKSLIGAPSCDPSSGNEACGRELATWLEETDHNQNIARMQNISTYTIGFNINSSFLADLAGAGGGTYYDAASSEELVAVFQDILGDVLAVDTSFVAPGATVNQFNRLTHRNDIYFALFKPDARPSWSGNLKRYHLGANGNGEVTIQDANFDLAIDDTSGFFKDGAKSWWSDAPDGSSVPAGGVASKISLAGPNNVGSRRMFTYTNNSIPTGGINLPSQSKYLLHEDNVEITEADLGIASTYGNAAERNAYRTDLLKWARGVDILDNNLNGDVDEVRTHIGDPMHARPVILNYENGANTHTTIFVATNEGMLHAIEHENGTELYSIMPKELLKNIAPFYENQQSTKHPYGLDGDLSVWHEDDNNNVTVDAGEKAYLFVGMRRGGSDYYAFDVSDRLNPKLVWQIKGGTGDFAELGQTWSRMVPTSLMINNTVKKVLIFGGGYATTQDPNPATLSASQPTDDSGAAIYIVDAETGQRLWVGSGEAGGDKQFADMDYSIPADIRVIDINLDDMADQMYVGDMGGQLWRFDFTPFHQSGDLVDGGVLAKLNGSSANQARRLYNEPDVALIAQDGKRFLSVSLGSGWRAHPLNDVVEDRFYMIRSHSVYTKPEGYGKNTGTVNSPDWKPLTEDDLANVTDDLDPVYNHYGWMLELEGNGEKIMGNSITINNQVVFTSYEPESTGDACSPAIGGGSIYVVDVMNGAPTLDLDDDGNDESESGGTDEEEEGNQVTYKTEEFTKEDRKKQLKQGGIPPPPTALITESGNEIGTTVLVSTEQPVDADFNNLTQRTYWQDKGRGEQSPAEITASGPED
ncbi:MAG: PilC/PilY family type IV pilus protein [Granulosicoccus sp.]